MATASLPPQQPPTCDTNNPDQTPRYYQNHVAIYNKKSVVEAYILAVSPFGLLGAHHFYLQRYCFGIVYFFTAGLLGCGYLIDWFRVPCLVRQANEKIRNYGKDEKTMSDAYTLWFPMGLLGFHHYYLENYACGVLYTCTLGLGGIGWIIDVFRMPCLVRSANERRLATYIEKKSACLSVALLLPPFGFLGAHHYYLNRPIWGILYTLTLGLCGVGWVIDWFRIPVLLKRANKEIMESKPDNVKTVDDAYVLWLPFGLFGFHHFYLERPLWGFLYLFTLGLGGIGWLFDLIRIPWLVKETNLKIQSEQYQRALVPGYTGQAELSSTEGTQSIQGYYNYGMASIEATMPTNAICPSAPPEHYGYNYQLGEGFYPQTFQMEVLNNIDHSSGTYYPAVYNARIDGPQFPLPKHGEAPPPYHA